MLELAAATAANPSTGTTASNTGENDYHESDQGWLGHADVRDCFKARLRG